MKQIAAALSLSLLALHTLQAQSQSVVPTAEPIQKLMASEPISAEHWSAWRQRLAGWLDQESRPSELAFQEAERFLLRLAEKKGRLPEAYQNDYLAWYFLGGAYLSEQPRSESGLTQAEAAYRRSITLEPAFAPGHRNLAKVLLMQARSKQGEKALDEARLAEAEREIQEAQRLHPSMTLQGIDGLLAKQRGQYEQAIQRFEKALHRQPRDLWLISEIASCIMLEGTSEPASVRLASLAERFPQDGILASFYALNLFLENRPEEAYVELQRARALGTDPATILSPEYVQRIEHEGKPGWIDVALRILLAGASLWLILLVVMALRRNFSHHGGSDLLYPLEHGGGI